MSSNPDEGEDVITLEERSETDLSDCGLKDDDFHFLEELEHISSASITKQKVEIGPYIGHIGLPSGAFLEVLPKSSLDGFKPLYFLAKAGRISEELVTGSQEIGFSVGESFIEVVGEVYAEEVNRLLQAGIHKQYVPRQAATNHVKGRLRVAEQLSKQEPYATSFESQFNDLTADIPLNQLILFAAVEVARKISDKRVERRLQRQISDLQRVVSLPRTAPHPSQITLTRETQMYKPIVKFAEQILNETYIDTFGQRARLLQSVLINTETLFEEVVYSFVADLIRGSRYIIQGDGDPESSVKRDIGHLLRDKFGNGLQGMQPDVFLRSRGNPVWVADAKWREDSSPKRNNLYQVTSYQRKVGGPAIMFYPEQGGQIETVYELSDDEYDDSSITELRVVEVPLGGESYEEFETKAQNKIRTAMQAQLPGLA
ncbi:hypothetical protein EA462_00955 [Natrarchaeobius halalkaliphilus]|uniref:Restriction endonuclease n=1 Tax=Natrarchaeobius halalkaliphilus TaxID=1679091 RepID=A0A3N6LVP3_9EURY|nr:hypothetical protein [Natrarchaeobius halalkaliphilus]RQG92827.1 hypothetical protein EA462_00955 [Natrarchaeobius halalkaliphilus]